MIRRLLVKIDAELLSPYLIYNKPFPYSKHIILSPVTMSNFIPFQALSKSITVRKNSTFHDKKIIKMAYFDFLIYSFNNDELEKKYQIYGLSKYLLYAFQLLQLCCKDSEIRIRQDSGCFEINGEIITPQIFDDLRRIIIIQNDMDFDIDEFLNYDTEQRLLKAESDQNKNRKKTGIEDYIDSLVIAINYTEEQIMNMTIRKFWRYVKRYQLCENYKIAKTGESSGMVKFKEPLEYWMGSIEEKDKYKDIKTDEETLRNKIG